MIDLDSAVGRLDNILMSLYVVIALIIIACALVSDSISSTMPLDSSRFQDTGLSTLITGAGTIVLGQ